MYELESWRLERRSAYLYRILSDLESGTPRQLLFLELAKEADDQAALWARKIQNSDTGLPIYRPDPWVKIVAWLARQFGPRQIRLILSALKLRGLSVYSGQYPGTGGAGNMRTAFVNVNDGLVAIALLVMGVAGAIGEGGTILLTGVAGLLSGAFAMAVVEYISRREMFACQIDLEHGKLAQAPREQAELALIYQVRGMDKKEAYTLANRMIADAELGLDTLSQEAPSLNPEQPNPPWQAAMFSFCAFILGGAIPLLPFVLGVQRHPLLASMVLSCLAMFCGGALLSPLIGRHALWGGLRMLAIGSTAGMVAYSIGKVLGGNVG